MGLEITAIVISAMAFIVSIIAIAKETKNNKINLKSEYFKTLYMDLLLENIPNARSEMNFVSNKLTGHSKFLESVNQVISKSMYYKYTDLDYYNELKTHIVALEDFVCEVANKRINTELQQGTINDIEEKIETIYQCMQHKLLED